MKPIREFSGRTLVLATPNIDTDQIIPARFLTTTTMQGLGRYCFADWHSKPDGSPDSASLLSNTEAVGCSVLVAGPNFGCGSSREHAAWAMLDAGFRAVISIQIADIFRNNAARNGLLPIVVEQADHEWFLANSGVDVSISLETLTVSAACGPTAHFSFDPFLRRCLMEGVDELGFVLSHAGEITAYEDARA
jgi:3-isopropylmalate/(R)-2-methylmalate dehydratase small subunit